MSWNKFISTKFLSAKISLYLYSSVSNKFYSPFFSFGSCDPFLKEGLTRRDNISFRPTRHPSSYPFLPQGMHFVVSCPEASRDLFPPSHPAWQDLFVPSSSFSSPVGWFMRKREWTWEDRTGWQSRLSLLLLLSIITWWSNGSRGEWMRIFHRLISLLLLFLLRLIMTKQNEISFLLIHQNRWHRFICWCANTCRDHGKIKPWGTKGLCLPCVTWSSLFKQMQALFLECLRP